MGEGLRTSSLSVATKVWRCSACRPADDCPGLRLKPDVVFADPAQVLPEPCPAEPLSGPASSHRLALVVGLKTCVVSGSLIACRGEQTCVRIEDIAGHGGIQNTFAFAANLVGQRLWDVSHHDVIVPVAIRETHQPCFPTPMPCANGCKSAPEGRAPSGPWDLLPDADS